MAERFAYLSSLWFCLAVATVFPGVGFALGFSDVRKVVLVGVPLVLFAGATWVRNYDFHDQERMWSVDFELTFPTSFRRSRLFFTYVKNTFM
jgi:hypothetical protein